MSQITYYQEDRDKLVVMGIVLIILASMFGYAFWDSLSDAGQWNCKSDMRATSQIACKIFNKFPVTEHIYWAVCTLFFGVASLALLVTSAIRKPSMTIDKRGFTYRQGLIGTWIVPWSEVHSFRTTKDALEVAVGTAVTKPALKRKRSKGYQLHLLKGNVPPPEELQPVMEQYMSKAAGKGFP